MDGWILTWECGVQSIDSYMNIQLSGTEEFIDRKSTGSLGQVLIRCVFFLFYTLRATSLMKAGGGCGLTGRRCNNVLYVTAADQAGEGDRDTKMEG